jgi:hypothetical protein
MTKWVGEGPLAVVFPRLFSLSNHKDSMISDFLEVSGETRAWIFSRRRTLFHWEE